MTAALDDIDRPTQEERDSEYRPGSIKRVKLKNFLTYDNVEFFPGPRLNVVVGPNGTGKSTILCAICLGLGGQPPLLGRADDARLFIKHEKDQAMIEIELAPKVKDDGTPEKKHVIRRVIDRDRGSEHGKGAGASTYSINGHKSNLKGVKELVHERYEISIDNLCTFLPQDKVGNFSGFDKQALLLDTEKSLSGHLYQTHKDLIELEKALKSSGTDVASLENELARLQKENERLEREKELMEERQELLDRIDLLEKKKAWLLFDVKREEAKAAKEKREEIKKQRKEAEKSLRPLQVKHADVEGEHSKIQSRYKALETKIKKDARAEKDSIQKQERYSDEIENSVNDYQKIDAEQRLAERRIEKERLRLEEVEAEGEGFPSIEAIEAEISRCRGEIRTLQAKIAKEKRRMADLQERKSDAESKKTNAAQRLDKIKDDKKMKLRAICGKVKNVAAAYEYISQNRKMFRRKVWGPVAAEVQPKNQLVASYLEQHVASVTWKAFVVECKEDYDLLYHEIREKRNIPITIILVNNGKLDPPRRIYSKERMGVLRREHGFQSYLDETFTAPDPIMAALIGRHEIEKVLVGGEGVQTSLDRKDLEEFLCSREANDRRPGKQTACFFYSYKGSSFKYMIKPSRYTGLLGIATDDIQPAKDLKPGSDPRLKDQLAETIQKADELMAELQPEIESSQAKLNEWNTQGQNFNRQFKDAKRTKQDYAAYKVKLGNQRDKYEEAQAAAAKDNDKEKAKNAAKIKKLVLNSIASVQNAQDLRIAIDKGTTTLVGVKMSEDGLSESLRKLADKLQEKQAETKDLADQYQAADQDYNQKKKVANGLMKEADKIAPKEEGWLERLDQEDLPVSLEGVEDALDEAESKANNITDNPHVMRQYEERKKEIEKLQEQLDEVGGEKDIKKKQLDQKLNRWESQLINIVQKVSSKFSTYMQEVGCAGEIRLYTGGKDEENDDDENLNYNFKDWGVEILVKFREASSLQVLSAQTHSGGERSVSTIMYLMGLQNLMVSPFRCVDEINQGLDERNERLVFKRIVENSTKPAGSSPSDHCGQYFLITPKLLPNLDGMENENITVLFVFSGAHNFANCLDWNVDKFIEDKKRFLTQGDEDHESSSSSSRGEKRRSG